MTIVEAVKIILNEEPELTCKEITARILERKLYSFSTPNPNTVVNHAIRTHCYGLDFPSSRLVKHFAIVSGKGNTTTYSLFNSQAVPFSNKTSIPQANENDFLPEEMIQKYHDLHREEIKKQLLNYIMQNDPAFFEQLVVKLLVALGYGYSSDAGNVVGESHDGGIDGIIDEDKLGLSKIYIQAKRFNSAHKVNKTEIQAFSGAMKSVKKGVFITTSSFTKDAIKEANEQVEKNISLIDGSMITELMLRAGVGVRSIKNYETYEIDSDFFDL